MRALKKMARPTGKCLWPAAASLYFHRFLSQRLPDCSNTPPTSVKIEAMQHDTPSSLCTPLVGGKNIALLATGGTIAGLMSQGKGHGSYKAAALCVETLLASVPAHAQAQPAHITAEQVAQIDSKDMTHEVWDALAARCLHYLQDPHTDAIVITHGTDTLEETAWFLHCVLPRTSKPVILVSAMRPADAADADGPQNLADGLALAQCAALQGVFVVHAKQVHGARYVQKVHPWRIHAFASINGPVCAELREGALHISAEWLAQPSHTTRPSVAYWQRPAGTPWPRVAVLSSHADVAPELIEALLPARYQGLILQTTGNGTIHQSLLGALHQAQQQGLRIRLSSRCALGAIHAAASTLDFESTDLPAYKARVALALSIMT